MRPVLHGDLTALARTLLPVPVVSLSQLYHYILSQAHSADCYRKRFNRPHPIWGNGSLIAAARSTDQQAEPDLANLEYCDCLELVFAGLRHGRQSQSSRTRN